jgi:hypothetical protein
MILLEEIDAHGHENVLCTHTTTLEITKENHLTKKGNCILGICASKACFDLNSELKKELQKNNKFRISIKVDDLIDSFYGNGSTDLKLLNKKDMVFRKSDFICDRTVLINCTKSSNEINRDLVKKLNISGKKFSITFEIEDSDDR